MPEPEATTSSQTGGIDPQQLAQLQDLHLPEPVGMWPLAPGWWLLAVIVTVILLFVFFRILSNKRRINDDMRLLFNINQCYDDWHIHQHSARYFQQVNRLLREQAMQLSGRRAIARLTGANWLDYLIKTTHVSPSAELQYQLSEACYRRNVGAAVEQLHPGVVQIAAGLTRMQASRTTNTMASVSQ